MAKPVEILGSTSAPNIYYNNLSASPQKFEDKITAVTNATIALIPHPGSNVPPYSPRSTYSKVRFEEKDYLSQETLSSEESDQVDQTEKVSRDATPLSTKDRPLTRKHSGVFAKTRTLFSQHLYRLNHSGSKEEKPNESDTDRVTKKKHASFEDKKPLPPVTTKPRSNTVVVQQAEPVTQTISLKVCKSELDRMKRFIHILEIMEPEDTFYKDAKELLNLAQRTFSAINATLREKYETLLEQDKIYEVNSWKLAKAIVELHRKILSFYDQMLLLKNVLKDEENQIIKLGQAVDMQFYPALVLYLVKDQLIYNTLKDTLKDSDNVKFQDADYNLITRHFSNKCQLIDAYLNAIGIEANVDIQKDHKKVYVDTEGSKGIAASNLLLQISRVRSEDEVSLAILQNLINIRIQLKQNLFCEIEKAKLLIVENWIKKIEEKAKHLQIAETNPKEHPDSSPYQYFQATLEGPKKEEGADFEKLLEAITDEYQPQIADKRDKITQVTAPTITQTSTLTSFPNTNKLIYSPRGTISRVRLQSKISTVNAKMEDFSSQEILNSDETDKKEKRSGPSNERGDQTEKINNVSTTYLSKRKEGSNRQNSGLGPNAETLSNGLNISGGAKKKQASLDEKKSLPLIETKPKNNTVAVSQAKHTPSTVSRAEENSDTLKGCQPELNKMTQLIEILKIKMRENHLYPEAQTLLEIAQSAWSTMNFKLLKEFEKLLLRVQQYEINSWRIENTFQDLRIRMIEFYDQILLLKTVLEFEENQIVKEGKSIEEMDRKTFFQALEKYLEKDTRCYNTLQGYKNVNFFADIQLEDHELIKNHFINKYDLIVAYLNNIGVESNDLGIKKGAGKIVYVTMEGDSKSPALNLLLQIPDVLSFDEVTCKNLQNLIIKRMNFRKKLSSENENAKLVIVSDWLKTIEKMRAQIKMIKKTIDDLAGLVKMLKGSHDEPTQHIEVKNNE